MLTPLAAVCGARRIAITTADEIGAMDRRVVISHTAHLLNIALLIFHHQYVADNMAKACLQQCISRCAKNITTLADCGS